MGRISEPDLVVPALKIIANDPGISTSNLIKKLVEELRPAGEDLEILSNRKDTKFSQKVRNLRSHKTLDQHGPGYTRYEKQGRNGHHWITPKGKAYLIANREPVDYLVEHDFSYTDVVHGLKETAKAAKADREVFVYPEDLQISEGARRRVSTTIYERSRRLRDASIQYYSKDGSIKCEVCGFDFSKQYGKLGEGYIEMHHKKPLIQYGGQATSKFIQQAIKDLAPLCSNCHRMIHRSRTSSMTIDRLRSVVRSQDV